MQTSGSSAKSVDALVRLDRRQALLCKEARRTTAGVHGAAKVSFARCVGSMGCRSALLIDLCKAVGLKYRRVAQNTRVPCWSEIPQGGSEYRSTLGWSEMQEGGPKLATLWFGASPLRGSVAAMLASPLRKGSLFVLLHVLCYRVGDEGESIHVPSLGSVGVDLCGFLHGVVDRGLKDE